MGERVTKGWVEAILAIIPCSDAVPGGIQPDSLDLVGYALLMSINAVGSLGFEGDEAELISPL